MDEIIKTYCVILPSGQKCYVSKYAEACQMASQLAKQNEKAQIVITYMKEAKNVTV